MMMLFAIASVIFLLTFKPIGNLLVAKLEIFNDITTLVLLYNALNFTNYVSDVHTQSLIGFSFIFYMSLNMAVHLFFLLDGSFKDWKKKFQSLKMKMKVKHEVQKRQLAEDREALEVASQLFTRTPKKRKRQLIRDAIKDQSRSETPKELDQISEISRSDSMIDEQVYESALKNLDTLSKVNIRPNSQSKTG